MKTSWQCKTLIISCIWSVIWNIFVRSFTFSLYNVWFFFICYSNSNILSTKNWRKSTQSMETELCLDVFWSLTLTKRIYNILCCLLYFVSFFQFYSHKCHNYGCVGKSLAIHYLYIFQEQFFPFLFLSVWLRKKPEY